MQQFLDILTKQLKLKIPVWVLTLIPLTAYLIWEYYWYTQVGLTFVKWHTHIMLYVYIWLLGAFLMYLVFKFSKAAVFKNLFLGFSAVVLVLLVIETILVFTGYNKTYLEQVGNAYFSPYTPEHESHYHLWPTDSKEHWLDKPEYKYWRPTNSLGYPDHEWHLEKTNGEYRILALGDSFTEGDGAPYDSSYVAILRDLFSLNKDSVCILNAGVSGSDPFFDFKALKDNLIIYQPDIILQTLSAQDLITDIIIRGGAERFAEEGLQFNDPPWWEPIYAISFISRFYFQYLGYTELLRKEYLTDGEIERLNDQIIGLFNDYQSFCEKHEIELVIILRLDKDEIINRAYNFDFNEILAALEANQNVKIIDLMEAYPSYMKATNTHVDQYFWEYDGHHNSKGYEMMAKCIYDEISPLIDSAQTDR